MIGGLPRATSPVFDSKATINKTSSNGMSSKLPPPRVIVAQLGARRHYLVPVTLHHHGMLERFYTDIYIDSRVSRLITAASASIFRGRALRSMAGRRDNELPSERVTSFPLFGVSYKTRAYLAKSRGELTRVWLWAGKRLGELVVAHGIDNANAAYGYSSAALECFEAAKAQKKLCILDYATAPKRFEDNLTAIQTERYPGWSSNPPITDRWQDAYAERQNREAELADLILCGSHFIKNAVEQESGHGNKCTVVPLGLRALPQGIMPKKMESLRQLRVLFVGDDAIRKGIGDFCRAVDIVGRNRIEARVVGNVDLSEYGRRCASRSVSLLGPIPRNEMRFQYEWADVCVLPSISDTFGLVVLEAMSYGVPVITTPNTGAAEVIENGINGYVVPIMDPESIAERVAALSCKPALLAELSRESLRSARANTTEYYAKNLVTAITTAFMNGCCT